MAAPRRGRRAQTRAEGLFAPDSPLRLVHREGVLLLGGGRALLLQLAHPLVAAGVADHSNFRADPFGRLRRTLDAMLAIVFADRATALAWARRVHHTHERVRGVLGERAGPFVAGTPYEANDPELLLWVHATLIDSALFVYRRFFGELDSEALVRYYDDSRIIASLLGVPDGMVPRTLPDFEAYVEAILRSDTLTVTNTARELAGAVLHPPVPILGGVVGGLASLVTVAMLPERIRTGYRLSWGPVQAAAWRTLLGAGRLTVPRLPHLLRDMPQARRPPAAPTPTGVH